MTEELKIFKEVSLDHHNFGNHVKKFKTKANDYMGILLERNVIDKDTFYHVTGKKKYDVYKKNSWAFR